MGFIVAFTYKKLMIFYVRKLSYLPGGEIVFADEKHESIKDIENESNIFLGNLVIASNIDEDVNFTKEDIEDFLSPKQYEFIDSFSKTLLEK